MCHLLWRDEDSRPTKVTFFQYPIVNLVGRLAVVEDPPRHRHVEALGSRSEVVRRGLKRRLWPISGSFVFCYGVVAVAWPNVHLLAQMLDHLLEGVVMVALRRQLLLRVVRRVRRRALPAVHAALRNARVEVPDEARVVEALVFDSAVLVGRLILVPEQRVPLSFRGNGVFVVAVVGGPSVGEILVVRLVFVNVVEVVREVAVVHRRRVTVQRSSADALKAEKVRNVCEQTNEAWLTG